MKSSTVFETLAQQLRESLHLLQVGARDGVEGAADQVGHERREGDGPQCLLCDLRDLAGGADVEIVGLRGRQDRRLGRCRRCALP